MTRLPRLALRILLALLPAAPAAGITADELEACVRDNFPEETSVQQVVFRATDRVGATREIRSQVWWKRFDDDRSRVLVRVNEPADLRGSAVLLVERESEADLFTYLPELRKVRRITTQSLSGSLFGSDFTYQDFQYVQGLATEGETALLPDEEIDGVAVHVSEHRPAPGKGSAYERIVSYVERETCLPVRTDFFEAGRLRKRMSFERAELYEQDGVRIPTSVRMDDLLNESFTTLEITSIEVGVPIQRRVFDVGALERSGP